ncbi:COP9 signalosome complex subunit 8 [Folsomia candida]|uniref:COP9 signalosome complex subunit 8 n=1 Tax=Folsomia candida TaxID=158441 RepID=UPI000B8F15DD|nr:COP9 signalosome complex subunit 8 [Folsomia candida]
MDERIDVLEMSELEGGPEGIGGEGYTQLLALYLATGQICSSKFLWKRIPQAMKAGSEELAALWAVGQTLWLKDTRSFHNTVKAFQWSTTIAPIVAKLIETVRETTLRLLGTVYTCVNTQDAAELLGLSEPEVCSLISPLGWTIQNGLLHPAESVAQNVYSMSADDQIAKLTDYVSVLEN